MAGGSKDKTVEAIIQGAGLQSNGPTANSLFGGSQYSKYQVYMGQGSNPMPYGQARMQGGPSYDNQVMQDYQTAVLAPTQWDDATLRKFVNQGIINKVPGFDVGMGMPQIQAAWQNMVDASIMFNQGGNNNKTKAPWSPWDVLNTWQDNKGKFGTKRDGDWIYDVATGERIKYVGPTSKTTTEKHVDLSSPADVKAIATQALRELLGRAPTAKELAQFKSSINAEEKANPTVTTTTQQLKPNLASGTVDVTSQSSTTSGGVSDAARAALVQDPTMQTKEYGKYQSATTYWDAMMQMLAGGS